MSSVGSTSARLDFDANPTDVARAKEKHKREADTYDLVAEAVSFNSKSEIAQAVHAKRLTPKLADTIVCLFVPIKDQKARLGDLEETYIDDWLPRFGPVRAGVVYTVQAIWITGSTIGIKTYDRLIDGVVRAFRIL